MPVMQAQFLETDHAILLVILAGQVAALTLKLDREIMKSLLDLMLEGANVQLRTPCCATVFDESTST